MEYRNLGQSGLKVSSLCLGAMTFGEPDANSFMHNAGSTEKESRSILEAALEAGINFVDTANVYGNDGLSERILGNWFADTGRRDEVVLATKFRFRMWKGPTGAGGSRLHILRAVEDSLTRLKTDHIDLYQIHMQDIETPEEETLRALDDLVRQGKVRYIGCSNYAAYRLMDSLWISRTQHLERFVTAQMRYNLASRELEREHVPLCRRNGVGILPWSPLQNGLLTGRYRKDEAPEQGSRLAAWSDSYKRMDTEKNWAIVAELVAVAEQIGASAAQVALAWLLAKPMVTSVIIGVRKMSHLKDNLEAASLALSPEHMQRLDKVSALEVGYPYDFLGRIQKDW